MRSRKIPYAETAVDAPVDDILVFLPVEAKDGVRADGLTGSLAPPSGRAMIKRDWGSNISTRRAGQEHRRLGVVRWAETMNECCQDIEAVLEEPRRGGEKMSFNTCQMHEL